MNLKCQEGEFHTVADRKTYFEPLIPRSSVSPVSGIPIDLVRSRVSQNPDIGSLLRHLGRLMILLTWN